MTSAATPGRCAGNGVDTTAWPSASSTSVLQLFKQGLNRALRARGENTIPGNHQLLNLNLFNNHHLLNELAFYVQHAQHVAFWPVLHSLCLVGTARGYGLRCARLRRYCCGERRGLLPEEGLVLADTMRRHASTAASSDCLRLSASRSFKSRRLKFLAVCRQAALRPRPGKNAFVRGSAGVS